MAPKIPAWAKASTGKTLYDKYDNARSWITDTVETPADKKNLKSDLQKLRAEYLALKAAQSSTGAGAVKALQQQVSPKGVAAAEAQARAAIEKKYPKLYVPEIKKASDLSRSKNKNYGR